MVKGSGIASPKCQVCSSFINLKMYVAVSFLLDYLKKKTLHHHLVHAGLKRCGKSCRLRWINYLSPSVKRGDFSEEEEDLIIRLHKLLGNRFSLIFVHFYNNLSKL